jgi:phage shock protein A
VGLLSHLQNIFTMKADAALNAAEDPGQVFDYSYTKQLEQLQQLRCAIAEVVTIEKHIELLEAQVEVRK